MQNKLGFDEGLNEVDTVLCLFSNSSRKFKQSRVFNKKVKLKICHCTNQYTEKLPFPVST